MGLTANQTRSERERVRAYGGGQVVGCWGGEVILRVLGFFLQAPTKTHCRTSIAFHIGSIFPGPLQLVFIML